MSEPTPPQHHRTPAPPRSRDRHSARFGRATATSLVALVGLAVIVLGPAAVAVGWYTHNEIQASQEANRNPLGSEVSEGPATFLVEEVRCGADEDTVHGQRCQVEISVRNDGGEELTVPGLGQVLRGPDGVRYLPVDVDSEPFGTLEPGEDATAVFDYDIPTHGRVTHVGVHVDVYSQGELVSLNGPPLPLHPATD